MVDLAFEPFDYTKGTQNQFAEERPVWRKTEDIMRESGIDDKWLDMAYSLDKLRDSGNHVSLVIYHVIMDRILGIELSLLKADDMSDSDLRQLVKVREEINGRKVYLTTSDKQKVKIGNTSIRAIERGRSNNKLPASIVTARVNVYNTRVKKKVESFSSITTVLLYRYTAKPNKFVDDVVDQALERLVGTAENIEKVLYAMYTRKITKETFFAVLYDLGYLPGESLYVARCMEDDEILKREQLHKFLQ